MLFLTTPKTKSLVAVYEEESPIDPVASWAAIRYCPDVAPEPITLTSPKTSKSSNEAPQITLLKPAPVTPITSPIMGVVPEVNSPAVAESGYLIRPVGRSSTAYPGVRALPDTEACSPYPPATIAEATALIFESN